MKIAFVLAASLVLTNAAVTPVHAEQPDISKFFKSLAPNKNRKSSKKTQRVLEQVVAPAIIGAVGGAVIGGAAGGNKGAKAGAVVGAIATVGVLMALEESHRQGGQIARNGPARENLQPKAPRQLSEREILRETWRRIQQRLNDLGFDAGPADGVPGNRTRQAIQSFQASVGHDITGELTPEQTALLYDDGMDVAAIDAVNPTSTAVPAEPQLQPAPAAASAQPEGLVINPNAGAGQQQAVAAVMPQARQAAAPDSMVLGVKPLLPVGEAEAGLRSAYDACERKGSALVCSSGRDGGVTDTLVVGYSIEGGAEIIHTLSRQLSFEQAVQRSDILGQLATPYPDLIFVPQMTLASTRDCVSRARAFQESRFRELLDWARSGAAASERIEKLAQTCDFHYSIDVPAGERVNSIVITLFNGKPIRQTLAAVSVEVGGNPQIRF